MKKFSLSRRQRLIHAADFARLYAAGQRAGDHRLLVFAAPNELGITRIGLSVSKKHGNAVRRCRLKRLLREAYRLSQHELPQGFDVVLIPRQGVDATVGALQRSLTHVLGKLARRLAPGGDR